MSDTKTEEREIVGEDESRWTAFPAEAVVAHGKQGAVLAFRPADDAVGEQLVANVTFNSMAAANFALSTMATKELQRRLSLARKAAAGL